MVKRDGNKFKTVYTNNIMKSSKLKGISLQEKVFIVWNVMIIDLFHNHVLCNKRYLNYKYIYSFLVISNNDTLYSYYFSSIKHRSINYFCKSFIRPPCNIWTEEINIIFSQLSDANKSSLQRWPWKWHGTQKSNRWHLHMLHHETPYKTCPFEYT